jgi:hypothetical protein
LKKNIAFRENDVIFAAQAMEETQNNKGACAITVELAPSLWKWHQCEMRGVIVMRRRGCAPMTKRRKDENNNTISKI